MHPISEFLFGIYNSLLNKGEIFFPLLDEQKTKIDSIVKTVNSDYFGFERFPTPQDKAAAYFCLIIKNHPVTDGNKRLAVFTTQVYVGAHDLVIVLPNGSTLDEIAVAVEASKFNNDELVNLVKIIFFGDTVIKKKQ